MTRFELAGAMALAASLLAAGLITDWARHDPSPPRPVRLADRSTWRRKPSLAATIWPHVVGMIGLGAALFVVTHHAPH